MADFLHLTDSDGMTMRVHYQAIDVIGHARFPIANGDITYVDGSRLMLDNGGILLVHELPDYIEHLIEAIGTEYQTDINGDIEEDGWSYGGGEAEEEYTFGARW